MFQMESHCQWDQTDTPHCKRFYSSITMTKTLKSIPRHLVEDDEYYFDKDSNKGYSRIKIAKNVAEDLLRNIWDQTIVYMDQE